MKNQKSEKDDNVLSILPLETGVAKFCILGTTPLIQNRLAEKARMELLFPRGRLSSADKKKNLKHDPIGEFRSAAYAPPDKEYATRLIIPARAFSKALAQAALDTPGAAKTEIIRLTWIVAENGIDVPLYGIPQVYMAPVRMADQKKTPDIRTRAILALWACYLIVRYMKPQLTAETIGNLLARAGALIGIGDDRHEKGGSHGMFELVSEDNERFQYLIKHASRVAQNEALAKPTCFDAETEELLSWFDLELVRRERETTEKKEKKGPAKISSANRRNDRYRDPFAQPEII
jgi:hypothetical protein